MKLFRLALRILRNEKLFSVFFTLNLALGLSGYLTIESFKDSLSTIIAGQAQDILGGDLSVSARRPLTEMEVRAIQEALPEGTQSSRVIEFFAMLTSNRNTSLVLVRAVDENYPLRRNLVLAKRGQLASGDGRELQTRPLAWADPILLERFGFSVGEQFRLGSQNVQLDDSVVRDSSQASRAFAFGGRLYVGKETAFASDLLKPGSTATYSILLSLAPEANAASLRKELSNRLPDPAVSIRTTEDAGDQSARAITLLGDYLGLAALVSMCLAALGSVFLFADYLRRRYRDIAILFALGASLQTALALVAFQLGLLTLAGISIAALGASALLPLLVALLQSLSPVSLDPSVGAWTIARAFLVLAFVLGSLFFPLALNLRKLATSELFRSQNFVPPFTRKQRFLYIPACIIFCLLAVWQAKSWKVGATFIAGLFAAALLLLSVGALMQVGLRVARLPKHWIWKEAIRNWQRRRWEGITVLLAIGLGILLTNLLPQVAKSLRSELNFGSLAKMPSLFFFDIQEEQKNDLQEQFRKAGLSDAPFSPLIRARLLAVNNQSFERAADKASLQTREEELEARFRNRGVNLTIRERPQESETIVAGKPFSASPIQRQADGQEIAEISVEYRFAQRLGLKLEDQLRFDVQGVEVLGRIRNLRKVNWLSFQPNFFIVFPPGLIDGAPKTYLTTLSKLPEAQRLTLQRELSQNFSNVSQVNVEEAIRTIFDLVNRCQNALLLMAVLAITCGLLVIATVFAQQIRSRRNEFLLLKILGASDAQLWRSLALEFFVLIVVASTAGALISLGIAHFLLYFFFETPMKIDWLPIAFCFGAILLLSAFSLSLFTLRWLRHARPLELIQS